MLKNGFYNAVGAVTRAGIMMLTIPLLIWLIGVEEYGLWSLVSATIAILGLAEGGLSVSTTVFVSQDLAKGDADGISRTLTVTVGAMLVLATIAAIALWTGATALVSVFPTLEQAQQIAAIRALQISALVVWARLLQQVLVGVEQAYQRYESINILNTLQVALSSLGMLVVAWLGGKTVAIVQWQAAIGVGVLIAHVWVGWLLVRSMKPYLIWDKTKGLAIASYSLMTWMASLGGVLFSQVDRLIVGASLGTGVLGIYAAITNITLLINLFSAVPVQPLLPVLSNLTSKQGIERQILQRQVKQAFQINTLIAIGMGAALFTLAPPLVHVVIPGAIADEYVLAFRIATVIYALYSLNAVGYYILFATKAVNICMGIQLVSGALSLLLIAFGAGVFGLLGSVAGNAGYLGTSLMIFFGMKQVGIPIRAWVVWLRFPLIWFLIAVLVSFVVPDRLDLRIFIVILQTIIIGGWLMNNQKIRLKLP